MKDVTDAIRTCGVSNFFRTEDSMGGLPSFTCAGCGVEPSSTRSATWFGDLRTPCIHLQLQPYLSYVHAPCLALPLSEPPHAIPSILKEWFSPRLMHEAPRGFAPCLLHYHLRLLPCFTWHHSRHAGSDKEVLGFSLCVKLPGFFVRASDPETGLGWAALNPSCPP